MTAFTVTATQLTAKANGMSATLDVLTGQAALPAGAVFSGAALSDSFTPGAAGSLVFGAQLGTTGTWTAEPANSPYLASTLHSTLQYIQLRSALTAGGPVVLGSSAGGTPLNLALAEILAGTGLAVDASSPGPVTWVGVQAITSPSFTPPAGSVLVLAVSSNGGAGASTVGITDTSGLGLTWAELARSNVAASGYAGVWAAVVPGGGTTRVAQAALTVTPALAASAFRAGLALAALAVAPQLHAAATHIATAQAALAVAPRFRAEAVRRSSRAGSGWPFDAVADFVIRWPR